MLFCDFLPTLIKMLLCLYQADRSKSDSVMIGFILSTGMLEFGLFCWLEHCKGFYFILLAFVY